MSGRRRATIDIDKAVHLYADGELSCHEVGRRVGCSGRTLLDRLREHGVPIRHSCIPGNHNNAPAAIDEARLLKLYVEQRKSAVDCARALGVSDAAVLRRLRRLGIQVRPASEGLRKGDVTDEQAVSAYWDQGLSLAETARKLHKSESWVKKALARSGRGTRSLSVASRKWRGTAHIDTAEVVRLYETNGWTCERISRYFGKSRDFARQRLMAIGKPRRRNPQGPDNPAWNGRCRTLYDRLRAHPKSQRWRRACMKRDDSTCRLTGQGGGKLHVHHIRRFSDILAEFLACHADLDPKQDLSRLVSLSLDYAPLWDTDNGMTLCVSAHRRLHAYRIDPALATQVATLKEQGLSARKMAKLLGKSRYVINRALRVLAAPCPPTHRWVA